MSAEKASVDESLVLAWSGRHRHGPAPFHDVLGRLADATVVTDRPDDAGASAANLGDAACSSVELDPESREGHREIAALLAVLHRGAFDPTRWPVFDADRWRAWDRYRETNDRFAATIAGAAASGDVVLVDTVDLALVPARLRKRRPDLRIAAVHDGPHAPADTMRLLPDRIARALVESLAQVVTSWPRRDAAEHFAAATRAILGRPSTPRAFVNPVGPDVATLARRAGTANARAEYGALSETVADHKLVVAPVTFDGSANATRSLRAYESLLEEHPEWHERIVLHVVAIGAATDDAPGHRAEMEAVAHRVGDRWGGNGWTPVRLILDPTDGERLAHSKRYDVALANSLGGAPDRSAREGAVLNSHHGQLVLSRESGAAAHLSDAAIVVNPYDVRETAYALHTALSRSFDEREVTALRLREFAATPSPDEWFNQLVSQAREPAVEVEVPDGGRYERWDTAAADYSERDDPIAVALTSIGLAVTGDAEGAREVLRGLPARAEPAERSAQELAEGVLAGLGDAAPAAVQILARSVSEGGFPHPSPAPPDSTMAVAATIAVESEERSVAQTIVEVAGESDDADGPHAHEQLVRAWVALRSERWAVAETELRAARELGAAGPRAELLAAAVDLGLALRTGDLDRVARAWDGAAQFLQTLPIDLLVLPAVEELLVAAARLGRTDAVAGTRSRCDDLLDRLGHPPVWTTQSAWRALRAAVAAGDPGGAIRVTRALTQVDGPTPALDALRLASRVMADAINGDVDLGAVSAAADTLVDAGLRWEASRLVGVAAVHTADASAAKRLLVKARDLRRLLPKLDAPDSDLLTPQEREVARRVVAGLTYKEIGAELFISPKTVEHHVARIRTKLGATTRAQMLTRLRRELEAV